jgi:hypothetical protein
MTGGKSAHKRQLDGPVGPGTLQGACPWEAEPVDGSPDAGYHQNVPDGEADRGQARSGGLAPSGLSGLLPLPGLLACVECGEPFAGSRSRGRPRKTCSDRCRRRRSRRKEVQRPHLPFRLVREPIGNWRVLCTPCFRGLLERQGPTNPEPPCRVLPLAEVRQWAADCEYCGVRP